jgi:hypothetical protein
MVAFVFIPTFLVWLVVYWIAKYPARALGRFVVRRSPNVLSDVGVCVALTFLCWCVVMGLVAIVYTIGWRSPNTLMESGTIAALGLAPPLLIALFKGTLRARSASKAL